MCSRKAQNAADEESCVDVNLVVRVTDSEALEAYARARYAACWFDGDWEPPDLAQAVLEALVISNENPSPDEYGIEILDSQAELRDRNPRSGKGEQA